MALSSFGWRDAIGGGTPVDGARRASAICTNAAQSLKVWLRNRSARYAVSAETRRQTGGRSSPGSQSVQRSRRAPIRSSLSNQASDQSSQGRGGKGYIVGERG